MLDGRGGGGLGEGGGGEGGGGGGASLKYATRPALLVWLTVPAWW